ncbi:MAG TPA: hypothetical protein VKH46_08545, partial [Thermoanaerobaculia bacterium]|nr:hypothetical protein [Thermoanaerobaculia bacterium]
QLNNKVSFTFRLESRFNQNFWTNYGGFGFNNGNTPPGPGSCTSGNCGEFDPRSSDYLQFRGAQVLMTPGYKWIDAVTVGSNDLGQFDPFVIGQIRYIDRDNAKALLFQGSAANHKLTWDAIRISLPRLWAGPGFTTGNWTASDAAYGAQIKYRASQQVDFGGIFQWVNDQEIDAGDNNVDNGRNLRTRFHNTVVGARVGIHPASIVDIRGAFYRSSSFADPVLAGANYGSGLGAYSPVLLGSHKGNSWKADVDVNDPFGIGLSFNLEGFFLGANYSSLMAARRENDVLLTEGHDAAWMQPGPGNTAYGVFNTIGRPSMYGGWDGTAQQLATINVDNQFSDFDEPMAESSIGWKGITIVPKFSAGPVDLSAEYTHLGYDTNWQAYGTPSRAISATLYPGFDSDAGIGGFETGYVPFQDKKTDLLALHAKYVAPVGKGLELTGRVKYLKETDNRMNSARFLPYQPGDCPGAGAACAGNQNFYSPGNSSSSLYGNPPVITVTNPVTGATETGYKWKPFDSLSDDDRDMKYWAYSLGVGYQLTDELYANLNYDRYDVDLKDGNTAFQAYNLHEMAAGKHHKNMLTLRSLYVLGPGYELHFEYQYNFGTFDPNFGGGYVVQYADADISKNHNVPLNSPGFTGRFGGWNSLLSRDFDQQRLKAWLKVAF